MVRNGWENHIRASVGTIAYVLLLWSVAMELHRFGPPDPTVNQLYPKERMDAVAKVLQQISNMDGDPHCCLLDSKK